MGNLTLKKSKMSKINQDQLKKSIEWIRENRKQRNYVETVDLQIMLRDYNPDKEKRFNSSVVLPHQAKSTIKVASLEMLNILIYVSKLVFHSLISMESKSSTNKE